jgi:hypothetical protein
VIRKTKEDVLGQHHRLANLPGPGLLKKTFSIQKSCSQFCKDGTETVNRAKATDREQEATSAIAPTTSQKETPSS